MKKLFAAAVLLTAAVTWADAQTTDAQATVGRTYRIKLLQTSPPKITHDPAPGVNEGDKPATPAAPAVPATPEEPEKTERARRGFQWGDAFKQSMLFLSVQHGYALTQPKTRRDLHGPFFKDYFRSVRALHGWEDGGRFFTNYIAHPMEGSLMGFIQVQNDPAGARLKFNDPGYWRSRTKALAWSAAWRSEERRVGKECRSRWSPYH